MKLGEIKKIRYFEFAAFSENFDLSSINQRERIAEISLVLVIRVDHLLLFLASPLVASLDFLNESSTAELALDELGELWIVVDCSHDMVGGDSLLLILGGLGCSKLQDLED